MEIEDFKPKGIQLRHYFYIAGLIKLSGLVGISIIILT